MSPSIEIDEDVFELLKSEAEPFIDTPSTVLRRLLGVAPADQSSSLSDAEASSNETKPAIRTPGRSPGTVAKTPKKKPVKTAPPKRARAASGTLLPEAKYERPLLKALVDAGGQAPYRDIVDAVGRELKDELLPADFENLSSGTVRWQSRLQFVRLRLIERTYLDKDAPRGIWSITDAGRSVLADGE